MKRFIDETIAGAEKDGFVRTLMGRRRTIPELRSGNRQRRGLGERLAVNTVIQGTAADIIKLAMVRCHRALAEAGLETGSSSRSTTSCCSRARRGDGARRGGSSRREMVAAFDLDPPLAVDIGIGEDWLAGKVALRYKVLRRIWRLAPPVFQADG